MGVFDLGGEQDDRGFAALGAGELDGGRQSVLVEPGRHRGGGLAEAVPDRCVGDVRTATDQGADRARVVPLLDRARLDSCDRGSAGGRGR